MTNNFELFIEYIQTRCPDFDTNPDSYFTVEIIRRGKDNPGMPAANIHFQNFYISSLAGLEKKKKDIITMCQAFRARAYFSINVKSFRQVALNTLAELARLAAAGNFTKPYAIYSSCSGEYVKHSDRLWIIDLDSPETPDGLTFEEYVNRISQVLRETRPGREVLFKVPTRTGLHLIVQPFDQDLFKESVALAGLPGVDIKENHISLLYEDL